MGVYHNRYHKLHDWVADSCQEFFYGTGFGVKVSVG